MGIARASRDMACMVCLALCVPVHAVDAPVPFATAAQAEPAPLVRIPANTVIQLEMIDTVSSAVSRTGDRFALRLSEPLMSGAQVMLPAGTLVVGEIVHAARSGFGGKPGELILAARHIDSGQGPIRLRSSFGAAGRDRNNLALGLAVSVGVIGFVVKGKESELPSGSPLSARIAADTDLYPAP